MSWDLICPACLRTQEFILAIVPSTVIVRFQMCIRRKLVITLAMSLGVFYGLLFSVTLGGLRRDILGPVPGASSKAIVMTTILV